MLEDGELWPLESCRGQGDVFILLYFSVRAVLMQGAAESRAVNLPLRSCFTSTFNIFLLLNHLSNDSRFWLLMLEIMDSFCSCFTSLVNTVVDEPLLTVTYRRGT